MVRLGNKRWTIDLSVEGEPRDVAGANQQPCLPKLQRRQA